MAHIDNSRSSGRRRGAKKRATRPRKAAIQQRSKDTVAVILRATTRVLVARGYDGLTTNAVAEAAGVSIGSLYQYFPNKQALVAALLDRHVGQTMDEVRAAAPRLFTLPIAEAARAFVELMLDAHRVDPALHRVLGEQLPRVGDFRRIESLVDEGVGLARAWLEARASELRPLDRDLAAFIIVQTVEALTHATVITRPELLARPELVDEITRVIVNYVVAPPTAEARPTALARGLRGAEGAPASSRDSGSPRRNKFAPGA